MYSVHQLNGYLSKHLLYYDSHVHSTTVRDNDSELHCILWSVLRVFWPVKIMPCPWLTDSKQIWIRFFKWGTVRSCRSRDYKKVRGHSWRSKKKNCQLCQIQIRQIQGRAELADFFRSPTLTSNIHAVPLPKWMFSASFERSKSYLFGARSPWA